MLPGINPRQMKQVMRKMGMQQEELDVLEVVFKLKDKELVISNPSVSKVNMMGQETFQVAGEINERDLDATPDILDEDIEMVIEQAKCSKEQAIQAIEKSKGDLAEAIMDLKS